MKAASILMEILANAGVRYLFGNPGTTELTFLDALPDSRLEYIVGLQEATAVSAADGYAQASGTPGIAKDHMSNTLRVDIPARLAHPVARGLARKSRHLPAAAICRLRSRRVYVR